MRARTSSRTARYGEIAAAIAITPLRESSSHTNPMRRMFTSRSSLLKPRPFERCVRTTSPSSTSTLAPNSRSRCSSRLEMVLLPAPDIPVNQIVNPLCTLGCPVHGEMDAAFFARGVFPPPAAGALVFARQNRTRTRRAADAGISLRIKRVERNVVRLNVMVYLRCRPIRQRADTEPSIDFFDRLDFGPSLTLVPSKACSPRAELSQLPLQRTHFANLAAQPPVLRS